MQLEVNPIADGVQYTAVVNLIFSGNSSLVDIPLSFNVTATGNATVDPTLPPGGGIPEVDGNTVLSAVTSGDFGDVNSFVTIIKSFVITCSGCQNIKNLVVRDISIFNFTGEIDATCVSNNNGTTAADYHFRVVSAKKFVLGSKDSQALNVAIGGCLTEGVTYSALLTITYLPDENDQSIIANTTTFLTLEAIGPSHALF